MTDDVWEQLRQTYNRACNVDGSNGWECAASRQVKTLEQVWQKKLVQKSAVFLLH